MNYLDLCVNSAWVHLRLNKFLGKSCLFKSKYNLAEASMLNFHLPNCVKVFVWLPQAPEFNFNLKTFFSHFPASFRGTSGIDIDLRRVDIDQCPQRNAATGVALPLNIFAGTDKCKQRTTEVQNAKFFVPGIFPHSFFYANNWLFFWQFKLFSHLFTYQCVPLPGLGFRRGSYKCLCRRGFYYPDVKSVYKHFNGSTLEEEYAKLMQVSCAKKVPLSCRPLEYFSWGTKQIKRFGFVVAEL